MKAELNKDMILTVTIDNSEPVELSVFAKSMMSLANDYSNRHSANPNEPAKLYIKEIKQGSIIAELAPLIPLAGDLLFSNFDSIKSYAEYLSIAMKWLLGKEERPANIDKRQLNNIANIVDPVAQDSSGQMNIGVINNNGTGDVIIVQHINSNEANAIQNKARKYIKELQQAEDIAKSGEYSQVLMYWAQLAPEKATDQVVIESIWPNPVKVVMPVDIKRELGIAEPYPFSKAFLVDVTVETVNSKPKLYKITKYYDSIDKE